MSKMKRQDSKGRNLRLGESQRKDGRYVYKYTDIFGKPQFVYINANIRMYRNDHLKMYKITL